MDAYLKYMLFYATPHRDETLPAIWASNHSHLEATQGVRSHWIRVFQLTENFRIPRDFNTERKTLVKDHIRSNKTLKYAYIHSS